VDLWKGAALGAAIVMLAACQPNRYAYQATGGTVSSSSSGASPVQAAGVEVKDDPYEKVVTFVGPKVLLGPQPYGVPVNAANLRSWVDRSTGVARHQLYVVDYYEGNGWKFWTRANGEGAETLEFVSIGRDVGTCSRYSGCGHYETFGASIPDKVLKEKAQTGYSVKFYAKNGLDAAVTIPANIIAQQLAAIDERFPPKVTAAASRPEKSKKARK